jgi:hypothetical protein
MAEIKLAPNNMADPDTRAIALEGLRQAFQGRVAQLWSTVTLAGEPNPSQRFKKGFDTAVDAYEKAWHAIDKDLKDK